MTIRKTTLSTLLCAGLLTPMVSSALTATAIQFTEASRDAITQNGPAVRINDNGIGFGGGDNTPMRIIDYSTGTVTSITDSVSGFPYDANDTHVLVRENPTGSTQDRFLKCEIATLINTASLSSCQPLYSNPSAHNTNNLLANFFPGKPMLVNNLGWSLHYEDDGVTSSVVLSSPDNQQTTLLTRPTDQNSTLFPNFRTIITDGESFDIYIQESANQESFIDNEILRDITHIQVSNGDVANRTTNQITLPQTLFLTSVNGHGDVILKNHLTNARNTGVPQEIYSCSFTNDQCATLNNITASVLLDAPVTGDPTTLQGSASVYENRLMYPVVTLENSPIIPQASLFDLNNNLNRTPYSDLFEAAMPNVLGANDIVQPFAISPDGRLHVVLVADPATATGFDDVTAYLMTIEAGTTIPATTTLVVNPETTTLDTLLETTLNTQLDLNPNELFAIEVQCTPSNNLLSLQSRTIGDAFPPAPQSLLIDTSNLNQDLYAQAVTLSAFVDDQGTFNPAPAPLNDPGVYASLVYQAQPSTAGITDITCTALGSDADGTAQTISVTNATIVLQNGLQDPNGNGQSVTGVVLIPEGVDPGQVTVTLTIGDRSLTTTVDANGFYSFDNVLPTDITVSVDAPRAVAQCTDATVAGEALELADITLYRGDVNNDGDINIADFTAISSRFGLNEGDDRYRPRFDLNRDGTINIQDLAILGSAMGLSNCNPVSEP